MLHLEMPLLSENTRFNMKMMLNCFCPYPLPQNFSRDQIYFVRSCQQHFSIRGCIYKNGQAFVSDYIRLLGRLDNPSWSCLCLFNTQSDHMWFIVHQSWLTLIFGRERFIWHGQQFEEDQYIKAFGHEDYYKHIYIYI